MLENGPYTPLKRAKIVSIQFSSLDRKKITRLDIGTKLFETFKNKINDCFDDRTVFHADSNCSGNCGFQEQSEEKNVEKFMVQCLQASSKVGQEFCVFNHNLGAKTKLLKLSQDSENQFSIQNPSKNDTEKFEKCFPFIPGQGFFLANKVPKIITDEENKFTGLFKKGCFANVDWMYYCFGTKMIICPINGIAFGEFSQNNCFSFQLPEHPDKIIEINMKMHDFKKCCNLQNLQGLFQNQNSYVFILCAKQRIYFYTISSTNYSNSKNTQNKCPIKKLTDKSFKLERNCVIESISFSNGCLIYSTTNSPNELKILQISTVKTITVPCSELLSMSSNYLSSNFLSLYSIRSFIQKNSGGFLTFLQNTKKKLTELCTIQKSKIHEMLACKHMEIIGCVMECVPQNRQKSSNHREKHNTKTLRIYFRNWEPNNIEFIYIDIPTAQGEDLISIEIKQNSSSQTSEKGCGCSIKCYLKNKTNSQIRVQSHYLQQIDPQIQHKIVSKVIVPKLQDVDASIFSKPNEHSDILAILNNKNQLTMSSQNSQFCFTISYESHIQSQPLLFVRTSGDNQVVFLMNRSYNTQFIWLSYSDWLYSIIQAGKNDSIEILAQNLLKNTVKDSNINNSEKNKSLFDKVINLLIHLIDLASENHHSSKQIKLLKMIDGQLKMTILKLEKNVIQRAYFLFFQLLIILKEFVDLSQIAELFSNSPKLSRTFEFFKRLDSKTKCTSERISEKHENIKISQFIVDARENNQKINDSQTTNIEQFAELSCETSFVLNQQEKYTNIFLSCINELIVRKLKPIWDTPISNLGSQEIADISHKLTFVSKLKQQIICLKETEQNQINKNNTSINLFSKDFSTIEKTNNSRKQKCNCQISPKPNFLQKTIQIINAIKQLNVTFMPKITIQQIMLKKHYE